MSELDALVDAVLLPGFDGTDLPGWLADRLTGGLGGVCLFGQNVVDDAQVRTLTAAVHASSPTALVAADEEGGDVTRLEHEHGSSWPTAGALGRHDDTEVTWLLARALGAQAAGAGLDVVLGPVADVNADPLNPVIGLRSYGADPGLVARHTSAAVRGLQSAGVAACAKHWPGHGSTRVDSHLALPTVDDDLDVVRRRDLPPFVAAVDAGVRTIMTAHLRYPVVSDDPATVSPAWVSILRDDLGFDGVLVSDALDMAAMSQTYGRGPAAVRALAAGVDLICIGNPSHPHPYDAREVLDEVHGAVVAGVRNGDLPLDRLSEAAARVSGVRAANAPSAAEAVDLDAARAVAATVTDDVLHAHDVGPLGPVVQVVDLRGARNEAAGRTPLRLSPALRAADLDVREVDEGTPLDPAASVVAVVTEPHRVPDERASVARLRATRPDTVVVETGLPRGEPDGPTVRSWGSGAAHAAATARILAGVRS